MTEIITAPEAAAPTLKKPGAEKPDFNSTPLLFAAGIVAVLAVGGGLLVSQNAKNAKLQADNDARANYFMRCAEHFGSSLQQPLALYTMRSEKSKDNTRRFTFTQSWTTADTLSAPGEKLETTMAHQFTVAFNPGKKVKMNYEFIGKNPAAERPYLHPQVVDYLNSCMIR